MTLFRTHWQIWWYVILYTQRSSKVISALAEKRNIPQEITDGFVKWVSDQLDELKIKLTEKYQKIDMR